VLDAQSDSGVVRVKGAAIEWQSPCDRFDLLATELIRRPPPLTAEAALALLSRRGLEG
jgi:hypothetical protein